MSIYNYAGEELSSVFDFDGNLEDVAYDYEGGVVFENTYVPNTFSVLGDSYSTFEGYTARSWYPGNDVTDVNETWWKIFESNTGINLLDNISYSGSCICYDGYGSGTSDQVQNCFLNRMGGVGYPEYLFVFGGTNDSWVPVRPGEYKYADWTEEDKEYFRPALAYLLYTLKSERPRSKVIFIKNTGLSNDIGGSIDTICSHYLVQVISLNNITKAEGHPTKAGMQQIATQVIAAIG